MAEYVNHSTAETTSDSEDDKNANVKNPDT